MKVITKLFSNRYYIVAKLVLAILFMLVLLPSDGRIMNNDNWVKILHDTCLFDNNNHAAFTSMVKFKGSVYIAFREAKFHRGTETDKGKIVVLEKRINKCIVSHKFGIEGVDLRDPCFLVWKSKLLLYTNGYYSELSNKGWTILKPVVQEARSRNSIWKMRAHKDAIYGIEHSLNRWPLFHSSRDGINWYVINEFKLGGTASEADMVFINDSLFCCIRIDTPIGSNSLWGKSKYPYNDFQWSVMDVSVASPEMIAHTDHTILLAGREYDFHRKGVKDNIYVSLFALDTDGRVKKRYILDNSQEGDKGYPSFSRINRSEYMMSYYTVSKTNANNTCIKLLSFKIDDSY